jgi:hypothetical protein
MYGEKQRKREIMMVKKSIDETEQQRIERIVDEGNPVSIGLLKKEIQHKIDQAYNELSHYEFYLIQSAHRSNCTLCRELDQVRGKKGGKI